MHDVARPTNRRLAWFVVAAAALTVASVNVPEPFGPVAAVVSGAVLLLVSFRR